MLENPMLNLIKIDYDLIEQWNQQTAFKALYSIFFDEENLESIGSYNSVDEKDVLEIIYLILKHAKGTKTPNFKDVEQLATRLTVKRMGANRKVSEYYSMYNGEMTDFHLYFFLDKLFEPYSDKLLYEYGFNHYIVQCIDFLLSCHESFIFTKEDIGNAIEVNYDKEAGKYLLCMFDKFVEYFSDRPSLDSFESFQKSTLKKPFIRISENEYLFFWHWFRTSIILNLHYLLDKDEDYKRHKGDIFEEITASLFKHHLKIEKIYTNSKYSGGEVDVLIDSEDTILLIECKSGILYTDYKLGVPNGNLEENINSITGKAKIQLENAKKIIQNNEDICNDDGTKLELDANKNIMLLNVCFEFPVGLSNKDRQEEVIVLSLVDLMMVVDLLEDNLFGESDVKNIIYYLKLRKRALGFATDDELTIAISLLYNPLKEAFLDNPKQLSRLYLDSSKSISEINRFYAYLLTAKMLHNSLEYKAVEKNYKGFLRDYVLS